MVLDFLAEIDLVKIAYFFNLLITKILHMFTSNIYNPNLPRNVIVRLLHPVSGDSQDQETFVAPSADIRLATKAQSAQTTISPVTVRHWD